MRGQSKKVLTVGLCQKCGNAFEYIRHQNPRRYCSETCRKRMKVIFEQNRMCRLGLRRHPPKRNLIPYAGKE